MTKHLPDCSCYGCFVSAEADRRIDAGELDPWAVPTLLTELVADIVGAHEDVAERTRRAEWFALQLLDAVVRENPAEQRNAEILPFRPVRRG